MNYLSIRHPSSFIWGYIMPRLWMYKAEVYTAQNKLRMKNRSLKEIHAMRKCWSRACGLTVRDWGLRSYVCSPHGCKYSRAVVRVFEYFTFKNIPHREKNPFSNTYKIFTMSGESKRLTKQYGFWTTARRDTYFRHKAQRNQAAVDSEASSLVLIYCSSIPKDGVYNLE